MRKLLVALFPCVLFLTGFTQTQRRVSTYASLQFNATLYDINARNNPWGVGLGVQSLLNNRTRFKPAIEITGDLYLGGTKDFFPVEGRDVAVESMVNIFAGANYQITERTYLSLLIGPGFVNGRACFGVKPSVGLYFPRNNRWTGRIAYINIFNREPAIDRDFGSLSLSVGLKLF